MPLGGNIFRRERLSPEQLSAYKERGFILVSGLVRRDVAEHAYDRVISGIPAPTLGAHHQFIRDRAGRACFSRKLRSAARELAGAGIFLRPPAVTYSITVFPSSVTRDWPRPHIDHALEKDGYKTFPPPFRIGCLIYLNEVAPRSGGTVIWPGSHVQIEAMASANPKEYEYLSAVNRDLDKLVFQNPVEITAATGDVLFYHRLLAHAGSMNAGMKARAALNHKW